MPTEPVSKDSVGTTEAALAIADEAGADIEDDLLLVGRQISAQGRSRAFLGGVSVPASTLVALSESLVAVHGQSDQHRLLRADAQRDALDAFAGDAVAGHLKEYQSAFGRLREVQRSLHEVRTSARERAREADLLRLGLEEIEAVAPTPGEDTALAAEESRLGFADTLRAAAEVARTALSADEQSTHAPDALGLVAAARKALDEVREHDTEAAALGDRLAEVSYLLSEAAVDVSAYATSLETDPARLSVVSERRAALTALTRKYGDTIDEVLAWGKESARRLVEIDGSDERIEALDAERADLDARLAALADKISRARSKAATSLGKRVSVELTALALPHATLTIEVRRRDELTSTGIDEIEFLFTANTGSQPRPLGKGASGGELSRVMLALEVVLAATSPVPTFVFDEVDAGVGGKAAVEVGRRLAMLARSAQVLVVTHLPQVAAFADHHVAVAKSSDGSVTTSGLSVLDHDGRVRELSRMLAGQESSETAMAHAQELLEMAAAVHSGS